MSTSPGPRRSVIIDCDPGHDDALAILLALAHPEIEVRAITTVAGNAPLDRTTRNALRVLTLAGRTDVPVAAGADRPVSRPLHSAPEVHGISGLDGADLPEPTADPVPETAVELMSSLLESSEAPITLIPTGPLTNIGRLVTERPDLLPRIAAIHLMGGAVGIGNWTASAEFNIWVDPEAADIVMRCGRPVAMIGLDVTHEARLTPADIDMMEAFGNRTGAIFADLMRFYARFHAERYGWDGPPIHDAVAVAHVIDPTLVDTRRYPVTVATDCELTRGRTVVDTRPHATDEANVEVGVAIDRARFIAMILDAVRTFP